MWPTDAAKMRPGKEKRGARWAQGAEKPSTITRTRRKGSTVLVEKRDGRVVDFDPINIISAVKSAFADLDKKIGPQEDA